MPPNPQEGPAEAGGSPLFRYRFADCVLDEARSVLIVDGAEAKIEPLPRRLLAMLLHDAPTVVKTDDLLAALWPRVEVFTSVLTSAVHRVGDALGPERRKLIVNVRKSRHQAAGYRYDGPVERELVTLESEGNQAQQHARFPQALDAFARDILEAIDVKNLGSNMTLQIAEVLREASRSAAEHLAAAPVIEATLRMQIGERYFRLSAFKDADEQYAAAIRLVEAESSREAVQVLADASYGRVRVLVAHSKLALAGQLMDWTDAKVSSCGLKDDEQTRLASMRAKTIYLLNCQRYADALLAAREAIELTDRLRSRDLVARFSLRRVLVEIHFRLRDLPAAEAMLQEMMSAPYSIETVGEVAAARAQVQWARLKFIVGNYDEAELPLIKARDILIARFGEDDFNLGEVYAELARIYEGQGRFGDARQAHIAAYRINERKLGLNSQGARQAAFNLALLGLYDGHSAETLLHLEKDRGWFVDNMGGDRSPVVQLLDFYRVRAMLDVGRTKGVVSLLQCLQPHVIAQMCPFPYWADLLEAERGRLLVLDGRPGEGLKLIRASLDRLLAQGAGHCEVMGYQRMLDHFK